ncbi:hypothetical protein RB195_024983 [Necator americanus]|uniref:Uncharacterized protein n=1 Tax=Necator americanus TaxID=51031 RepID=A0ABR1ESJ3_NECAM
MLKNNDTCESEIQHRCAKACSAFNSSTKCLWSTPIIREVKQRVYLSANRLIMMYGSETWAAPSTLMSKIDCMEMKLLRRMLDYFWSRVRHNENLHEYVDLMYRRIASERYQHLAPPSKIATETRLRFFGHRLKRPADRLVQRVMRSLSGSSRKRGPGRRRKF